MAFCLIGWDCSHVTEIIDWQIRPSLQVWGSYKVKESCIWQAGQAANFAQNKKKMTGRAIFEWKSIQILLETDMLSNMPHRFFSCKYCIQTEEFSPIMLPNHLHKYIEDQDVRDITSGELNVISMAGHGANNVWPKLALLVLRKHFPRYLLFGRRVHRSPVNFPLTDQWRGAMMFSLICAWTNVWANHQDTGELRHHTHYGAAPATMSKLNLQHDWACRFHYSDVIMSVMASQITYDSIVCSTVCSGADQRTTKLRVTGLFWGESTGSHWIPITEGQ